MCKQCNGNGRYYREIFPGAWAVNACLCEESLPVRTFLMDKLEADSKLHLLRLEEARKKLLEVKT